LFIYFEGNTFKIAKLISGIYSIAFYFATYNNFNKSFYAFILYEVGVGMLYPTYSQIKSEYLPEKTRGTLMNIFKIPLNIIVIFLLFNMNTLFTVNQLITINFGISLSIFIVQMIFFNNKKLTLEKINKIKDSSKIN
jgi:hypothetical protein